MITFILTNDRPLSLLSGSHHNHRATGHVANYIKVAYPIILVVAGLIVSFIPGLPAVRVDPDLIFLIILPPLLFEAAWSISWKELWKWQRIISSFAFIVVFVSALSVALVANYNGVHVNVLQSQREILLKMNDDHDDLDEAILRQHLTRIDIEEERLRYI